MKMIAKLATLLALSPLAAFGAPTITAGGLAQGFNFDGVLTDANGAPITATTQIKLRILDPGANCMLFEEDHTSVTPASDGSFSLRVGGGTRTGNDSNYTIARIFQNSSIFGLVSGACTGYTPAPGDGRRLRVIVGGSVQLSPDFELASVPTAAVAETLQGRSASDFLSLRDDGSYDLNQANAENVFSTTNYAKLLTLLAGDYLPSAPTTAVSFNGQRIINVADPTGNNDVANKVYVDTLAGKVAGKTTNVTGVGAGIGGGYTLVWDQSANQWVAGVPSDSTKLPLGGGLMSGTIDMGNNQLINSGNVALSPGYTLKLGSYSSGTEPTLISSLVATDEGKTWYNSDTNKLRLWDGAAALDLSGDFRANGSVQMTGPFFASPGSAAAPSVTFAADPDTGFYRSAVDEVSYSSGGVQKFMMWGPYIQSASGTGGFLIATNAGGAAGPSYSWTGGESDTGMFTPAADSIAFSTAATEKVRITSAGFVGIGVSFPTEKIEVGNGSVKALTYLSTGGGLPGSGCAAPAGRFGFNSTQQIFTYCDATTWKPLVPRTGGEFTIASGAAVDFNNGDTQILVAPGGSNINITNMQPGGQYTVIIEDTTSRTYAFLGCTTTYYSPANSTTTNRSVYTIQYTGGNKCYIGWKTGYN